MSTVLGLLLIWNYGTKRIQINVYDSLSQRTGVMLTSKLRS